MDTPLRGVYIPHFGQISVKISVFGVIYPYRCTDEGWNSARRHGGGDLQLPVRPVALFPRVPEVSFVSWEIRSSRSYKPASKFGGRSANPPCSFWLGTLSLNLILRESDTWRDESRPIWVRFVQTSIYTGSRTDLRASWTGKCRQYRLTTIVRNSYKNGLRHSEPSLSWRGFSRVSLYEK